MGDRGAIGSYRHHRPLPGAGVHRRAHRAVSRHVAALSAGAHRQRAGAEPRVHPAAAAGVEHRAGRLSGAVFLCACAQAGRAYESGGQHRGAGAHRHVLAQAHRLSHAGAAGRGGEFHPRAAGDRERHLSRLADSGAGHALATGNGDSVRLADHRLHLRHADPLPAQGNRHHEQPRTHKAGGVRR